jgi:hypothetical protein
VIQALQKRIASLQADLDAELKRSIDLESEKVRLRRATLHFPFSLQQIPLMGFFLLLVNSCEW